MVTGTPPARGYAMIGAERVRGATGENKPCGGTVHHSPSPTWQTNELGDIATEAAAVWDAIKEGRSVTLRCETCDASLVVSLNTRRRR
jgi:hypothetical protein